MCERYAKGSIDISFMVFSWNWANSKSPDVLALYFP